MTSTAYDGRVAGRLRPAPAPDDLRGAWGRVDQLYPWIYSPEPAYPFVFTGRVASLTALNSATVISVPTLPDGRVLRITAFGSVDQDSPLSDFSLAWTLLVAGHPVPPLSGLRRRYGTLVAPTPIPGPGIIVAGGAEMILLATKISGPATLFNITARLDGYAWGGSV